MLNSLEAPNDNNLLRQKIICYLTVILVATIAEPAVQNTLNQSVACPDRQ
jgi:hypothetical protein